MLTHFAQDFKKDVERAKRWRGLRQDSGDPLAFIPKARAVYEYLGIDHRTKVIVFSDSLDVETAIKIQEAVDQEGFIGETKTTYLYAIDALLTIGLSGAFGIGTFFTNDYKRLDNGQKSKPLNMVIKIASAEGVPCIKISDDLTKVCPYY